MMGLDLNIEIMQCHFNSEGVYFKHFLFQTDIQGVSLKGKTNPNKTIKQPPPSPNLHIPWRWN